MLFYFMRHNKNILQQVCLVKIVKPPFCILVTPQICCIKFMLRDIFRYMYQLTIAKLKNNKKTQDNVCVIQQMVL